MSSKKCLTRVSSKSVLGECQARASHKSVKSECQARVSYQSVAQWCQARVSYKSVTSVCQVNVFNRWVRWKLWQISIKSLFLNIRVGIRVRGLHLVFLVYTNICLILFDYLWLYIFWILFGVRSTKVWISSDVTPRGVFHDGHANNCCSDWWTGFGCCWCFSVTGMEVAIVIGFQTQRTAEVLVRSCRGTGLLV